MQAVKPAYHHRDNRHAGLESKVPDSLLERPQGPAARIATFREDQHDASPMEHVIGARDALHVELPLAGEDGENAQTARDRRFPTRVKNRVAAGHRVDDRETSWEGGEDDGGVEPALVVAGKDEGGWGEVGEPFDAESEEEGEHQAQDGDEQPIEKRRGAGIGVEKRVRRPEAAGDRRPVVRPRIPSARRATP